MSGCVHPDGAARPVKQPDIAAGPQQWQNLPLLPKILKRLLAPRSDARSEITNKSINGFL
jgi:hypothetical protein